MSAPSSVARREPGSALTLGATGLALLAAWAPLPPLALRSALPSLALAVVALAVGVRLARTGRLRAAVGVVSAALLGGGLGILATHSSLSKLDAVVVWSALFAAMLRFATPLIFGALGGIFCERAGVINVALEGMMLSGAFFGAWGADRTGSWIGGLLIASVAGGAVALVFAFFTIHLRAEQIVTGFAINFAMLGLTGYLYVDVYGTQGTPSDLAAIPSIPVPGVRDIPLLGGVIGDMNLMIWLGLGAVALSWLVLFRTPLGLRIRAVGEHPRAADMVGLRVYLIRYCCVTISGVLAALGGAYLSIGFVNSFSENMTAGRGFIALAAVIFGGWRPFGAATACLLFGFSSALAERLPAYSNSAGVLFQALPYVLTLIAVMGMRGSSAPAASGQPYRRQ